ncbi:MAG: metallophosphoesterase [Verrucomicrobiota bacterium]
MPCASPDPTAWTLVLLPDSQFYSESDQANELYHCMLQWITRQREAQSIRAVLHLGDHVQHPHARDQWARAHASLSLLDGELPLFCALGNHDYGQVHVADSRHTLANDYLTLHQNPATARAHLASYRAGEIQNAAYHLAAGGELWLLLVLEFGPRAKVLQWARHVLQAHPHDRAILLTHDFIDQRSSLVTPDGSSLRTREDTPNSPAHYGLSQEPGGAATGEQVWQTLVHPHDRFQFVFNGHHKPYCRSLQNELLENRSDIASGYRVDATPSGNRVHQILFNAQWAPHGGDGWLRLLRFQDHNRTVQCTTFSPWRESLDLPSQRRDPNHEFALRLAPSSRPAKNAPWFPLKPSRPS